MNRSTMVTQILLVYPWQQRKVQQADRQCSQVDQCCIELCYVSPWHLLFFETEIFKWTISWLWNYKIWLPAFYIIKFYPLLYAYTSIHHIFASLLGISLAQQVCRQVLSLMRSIDKWTCVSMYLIIPYSKFNLVQGSLCKWSRMLK